MEKLANHHGFLSASLIFCEIPYHQIVFIQEDVWEVKIF